MTVGRREVEVARERGLQNVLKIRRAAEAERVPFAVACALFQKESGGRNVYGHDLGGAMSTLSGPVTTAGVTYPRGSDVPVTPANAAEFLIMVAAGYKSNGMGPAQITYARDLPDGRSGGYFRLMLDEGLLPWRALDNMRYGLRVLRMHYEEQGRSWERAGTRYNGRASYGKDLAAKIREWEAALA